MSMIGTFGICPKDKYDALMRLIQHDGPDKAENLIKEIYRELEEPAEKLKHGQCSGEIFSALFHYVELTLGIDVRSGLERFGEIWRETTGDFDVVVFYGAEPLLPLADAVDFDGLSQFVNDFFQADCGEAPQAACGALLNNLKSLSADEILIWHLC